MERMEVGKVLYRNHAGDISADDTSRLPTIQERFLFENHNRSLWLKGLTHKTVEI